MHHVARGISKSVKLTSDEAKQIARASQELTALEREVHDQSHIIRTGALNYAKQIHERFINQPKEVTDEQE
jgi:hypothetical protein